MSILAPQIETYLYTGLDGLDTITLTDSGGGPFTFIRSNTQTVSDALQAWEDAANAHGTLAGSYTFDWLPALQKVSFVCSETFTLGIGGSLPEALGFSTDSWAGLSSYTSDETPLAICNPINIDYEPPWAAEDTELKRYRWGRILSRAAYRTRLTRIAVDFDTDVWAELALGPLMSSRAVYYPTGYTSSAWSATNLRGYLDVFPYEFEESQPFGNLDGDTIITILGSVAV